MDEAIDIRYLLDVLRRRWLFFVLPVIGIAALSLAVAVLLPPVYVSTGTILVESQQIPSDLVRSMVTLGPSERIKIIEQRLMSRGNLMTVARNFNLQSTVLKGATATETVGFLRSRTTIEPVAQSGGRRNAETLAFSVSFEHENPSLATNIANELVTLILNEDARTRKTHAAETTAFLEQQAQRLTGEVEKADAAILKFKDENRNELPDRLGFWLDRLGDMQKRIAEIDAQLQNLAEQERLYELTKDGGEDGSLDAQLAAKSNQLREVSALYAASHPRRRQLQRQIELLEQEIEARNAEMAKTMQDEEVLQTAAARTSEKAPPKIIILRERRETLLGQRELTMERIEETQHLIDRIPHVGLALANLTRGLEATKSKLDEVWRKHADAELGERLEDNQKGERFELIEPPTRPTEPVKPNRMQILAVGIVLAFGAGGSGIVVTEMMDRSINSASELAARLNIRPLVVLPVFVTREEKLARRRRLLLIALATVALLLIVLAALHLLYMPLDEFLQKLVDRLLG